LRVSVPSVTAPAPGAIGGNRGRVDRYGDYALLGVTALASLLVVVVIAFIVYQLIDGATLSMSTFGLAFVGHNIWNPVLDNQNGIYGAAAFLYGTAVSSAMALLIGGPIGIAIGLFLSLLAPRRVGTVIGPLIELIAAIPSVVLGLWGVLVLAPVMRTTIQPALHDVLGWIPLFGAPSATGLGLFTAGTVLTIMVVPIIASISREIFLSVPGELKEGALALGATRWEMVRGVVLASTRSGIMATLILGLSRALGEAIAVLQVDGGGSSSSISTNIFNAGDTLAARVANAFLSPTSPLETSSLFYLAVILLVLGLGANLAAQLIVRRSTIAMRGAH
jgi:phosphate transport system permease protein